ncbi:hypothetical protein [Planctomicrobium sp. SH664]
MRIPELMVVAHRFLKTPVGDGLPPGDDGGKILDALPAVLW